LKRKAQLCCYLANENETYNCAVFEEQGSRHAENKSESYFMSYFIRSENRKVNDGYVMLE